jgi:hypothetical protein
MSDQQKPNQGTQQQDDWKKKNPDPQSGQHQGGQPSGQNPGSQKNPQGEKDQQKKSA